MTWSSDGLPLVDDDDDTAWTIAQAACLLGPPRLTVTQVRHIIQSIHMQPVGKRRTSPPGQPGRYARVYAASDFIDVYETMHQLQLRM